MPSILNKDQSTGMAERVLYGALFWVFAQFVRWGYIDLETAAWLAGGGVTAAGALWAYWINRPSKLLNAAGRQIPKNSYLVVQTTAAASGSEKSEARALAGASSDKVLAKTSA